MEGGREERVRREVKVEGSRGGREEEERGRRFFPHLEQH